MNDAAAGICHCRNTVFDKVAQIVVDFEVHILEFCSKKQNKNPNQTTPPPLPKHQTKFRVFYMLGRYYPVLDVVERIALTCDCLWEVCYIMIAC